ncbi:MAG: hypothetical protein KDB04_14005 [Acidimicrobiales bacterium]|nr:hypothetical protein [Acidimicrobiales bacterium]HRW38236.1 hypothetical protein [Aquihabitans sp.]
MTASSVPRWNPWLALAERDDIELWFASLGGDRGRWVRSAEGDEIVLEVSLARRARAEVLAHELVHAERGVGWPLATVATMQLEEERVWRIALDRLAPPAEVLAFVRRRSAVAPVTALDVADEFDLSVEAARRVLRLALVRSPRPPEGGGPALSG